MSSFVNLSRNDKTHWFLYTLTFILPWVIMFLGATICVIAFQVFFIEYAANFTPTTLEFLVIFPTFTLSFITLICCIKYFHKRKILSIFTARTKFDWNRVGFAMMVYIGVMIAFIPIGLIIHDTENVHWNFNTASFIPLMIMVFLFIPLQATFEEIFDRGFFLQILGKWFDSKILIIIIQALFFASGHLLNPITTIELIIIFCLGITLGIIAIFDNGLELAIGYHIINNFCAFLIISKDGNSLLLDKNITDIIDLIMFIITQVIILFIFAKKYHWKLK